MIDKIINDHLQRIVKYRNELEDIAKKEKSEFINNHLLIAATERLFQLSIESCINIGSRILVQEQFK